MGFFLKKSGIINFEIYFSSAKFMWKYSTGLKIDLNNWDKTTQRPKLQRGEQGIINKEITHLLNEYAQVLDILKKEHGKGLTSSIVKQEFNSHFKNISTVKISTYSDYYKLYISQKKESLSVQKDSWQKYNRIHTAIMELQKKNKTVYYLRDFDGAFFNKFIGYLRGDKQISDNTLKRKLGFFKSFLNWCVRNGYDVNTAYKDVQVKSRETYHVALSEKDLQILDHLELPEKQGYYRDLFLIGCYSGQRRSDYSRFDKKYIDGNRIVIRAKKTGQFSYIPLNPRLKKLLDKYDWILPTISGQKFNQHIHAFCKVAGFNETIVRERFYGNRKETEEIPRYNLIASHTARRTFITLSEEKGVPASATMNVCGIKSIKTYQNYLRLNKESMTKAIIEAWT
tara:strand:+ start:423 stop:1613 length:1191 start_codon:yes stop_codon:yes gene_type:complete